MNCLSCPKVDTCTVLCDETRKELENQEVVWHEAHAKSIYYNGEELRQFKVKYKRGKSFLTETEKKVIFALAQGNTREEISENLNISENALNIHLSRMRQKTISLFHQ